MINWSNLIQSLGFFFIVITAKSIKLNTIVNKGTIISNELYKVLKSSTVIVFSVTSEFVNLFIKLITLLILTNEYITKEANIKCNNLKYFIKNL